jgi:hypothetical protein
MSPTTVEDEVRGLYQGSLADFTGARQALARRLKKAGDGRATEVAELRKPSLSAWAVNQLFAHESRAMAAFVGAGERARATQDRAAAGGDTAPLRAALATIRDETPGLLRRAVELVAAAERAPGEAIVERIRTNLEALALEPANGAVAQRGWLDADLDPPGFEVMATLQLAAAGAAAGKAAGRATARPAPAPARPRPTPAPAPAQRPPERPLATVTRLADARGAAVERKAAAERKAAGEREARERREREQQERERRLRLERLRADLAEAERVAAERRQAAEGAAAEAERAAREAEAAQRRAGEAQARARETRQTAISAEAVAKRARAALDRAERGQRD